MVFLLVSEGRWGRMVAAAVGAVKREGTKDLGVGARARGKEQRMKTDRKRDWVLLFPPGHVEISRVQIIPSKIQVRKQTHKTRWEVGSAAEQDLVPQLPGGFCHLEMDFGRVANSADNITVESGVSQVSPRGRKDENNFA